MKRIPERAAVVALLSIHAALLVFGIFRNSVTFDENTHLTSGVVALTRGNFWISAVNPPLAKEACAVGAVLAGARAPADSLLDPYDAIEVAQRFMRTNATRYVSIFTAARLVTALMSVALAALVWIVARRRYGPAAGIATLALAAFSPELLAHGGLATVDLATALGFFATLAAFVQFIRTGGWRDAAFVLVSLGATFLVRFTAWALLPLLVTLGVVAITTRAAHSARRVVLVLLLMIPVALVALQLGYRGGTSFRPLRAWRFESARFTALAQRAPGLVLPLPDAYVAGFDHQMFEAQAGVTPTYLLGEISKQPTWRYTPIAVAVKWPLGLMAALVLAGGAAFANPKPRATQRRSARPDASRPAAANDEESERLQRVRRVETLGLALLAFGFFATSMFLVQLNVGVRYLLPALPPLFVLAAGALARPRPWAMLGAACVAVACLEGALSAPWYLSFFNAAAGGPGNGDRIVNDTNVDAGQGLIALREDLRRFGIQRVHLAYHGTTDPALYGIDYIPYLGGTPGLESDWIAISSYYFVGLEQRMVTPQGRTPFMRLDFQKLWNRQPAARPAHCMYLFRLR